MLYRGISEIVAPDTILRRYRRAAPFSSTYRRMNVVMDTSVNFIASPDQQGQASRGETGRGLVPLTASRRQGLDRHHSGYAVNAMSLCGWPNDKRRCRVISLPRPICCNIFRASGITTYMENGGSLERAHAFAAHESPRATKLYDRTSDQITLREIERIAV